MLVLIEYDTANKHANTLCNSVILFHPHSSSPDNPWHLLPASPWNRMGIRQACMKMAHKYHLIRREFRNHEIMKKK